MELIWIGHEAEARLFVIPLSADTQKVRTGGLYTLSVFTSGYIDSNRTPYASEALAPSI